MTRFAMSCALSVAAMLALPALAQDSATEAGGEGTGAPESAVEPQVPAAAASPPPLPPLEPLPQAEGGAPLLVEPVVQPPPPPQPAMALPVLATPAHDPIAPGRYCAKEPVSGIDAAGAPVTLGDFLMWVEVSANGGAHRVAFRNSLPGALPGGEQVLAAETGEAFLLPDGSLTFVFTDGSGNQGSARLYPTGLIDLEVVKKASGKAVTGNYGSFFVFRGGCAEPEFQAGF